MSTGYFRYRQGDEKERSLKSLALKSLRSLDSASFCTVLRAMGFASGSLYYRDGDRWVQMLATDEEWPVAVPIHLYYTLSVDGELPFGFTKFKLEKTERNHYEKSTFFYFPEQEFALEHYMFTLISAPGKRIRAGELHPGLEACASRVRAMVQRSHELRHTSEAGFRETVNALGIDLRSLIEHELRTPLASVTGYVSLLESLPEDEQFSAFLEYRDVIRAQSGYALEALEKLSLTLAAGVDQQTDEQDVQEFNGSSTIQEICVNVRDHAAEFLSPKAAENLQVKFHQALDEEIVVSANQRLFRWAIWEVLKNAASHARHGRIEVNSYYTDGMLVVDIMDDGLGLSPGSEELVFLRFYQDPTTNTARNGKRGLGLGLFLARHIVERHMGKLMFIRKQNRGGFFRFLWPAKRVSDLKREA